MFGLYPRSGIPPKPAVGSPSVKSGGTTSVMSNPGSAPPNKPLIPSLIPDASIAFDVAKDSAAAFSASPKSPGPYAARAPAREAAIKGFPLSIPTIGAMGLSQNALVNFFQLDGSL